MRDKKEQEEQRKEKEIARKIFGSVVRKRGPVVVTRKLVEKELSGGVIWTVCLGCGLTLAVHEEGAKRLCKKAKVPVPPSWEGLYFEAKKCPFLCGASDYKGVSLKRIQDLKED